MTLTMPRDRGFATCSCAGICSEAGVPLGGRLRALVQPRAPAQRHRPCGLTLGQIQAFQHGYPAVGLRVDVAIKFLRRSAFRFHPNGSCLGDEFGII